MKKLMIRVTMLQLFSLFVVERYSAKWCYCPRETLQIYVSYVVYFLAIIFQN